jgi:hypothetical protein
VTRISEIPPFFSDSDLPAASIGGSRDRLSPSFRNGPNPLVTRELLNPKSTKQNLSSDGNRRCIILEVVSQIFEAAGASCTPKVQIGIPHDEILSQAEVFASDLIVVVSTATGGIYPILVGQHRRAGDPTRLLLGVRRLPKSAIDANQRDGSAYGTRTLSALRGPDLRF